MASDAVKQQALNLAADLANAAGEAAWCLDEDDWEMVVEHAASAQKDAEELHHLAMAVNAPAVAEEERQDADREAQDWEDLKAAERLAGMMETAQQLDRRWEALREAKRQMEEMERGRGSVQSSGNPTGAIVTEDER